MYRPLWDVTTADLPWCPERCWLVTVPTDPFTTSTSPTGPFLSEWANCQPGNTQNGRTVLLIANLMADSESGSPNSYSSFLVTICLSRLVLEIFTCDRQTDRETTRTITIAGPHIVDGQLISLKLNKKHKWQSWTACTVNYSDSEKPLLHCAESLLYYTH